MTHSGSVKIKLNITTQVTLIKYFYFQENINPKDYEKIISNNLQYHIMTEQEEDKDTT